jgi:hypothetical protein
MTAKFRERRVLGDARGKLQTFLQAGPLVDQVLRQAHRLPFVRAVLTPRCVHPAKRSSGCQSRRRSQHLIDIDVDRPRSPCAARQREDSVEPCGLRIGGLEPHHGAEIIKARIDILAARQAFDHLGGPMTQTLAVHEDASSRFGLDRIARANIGDAVKPPDLPIGAARKNPTLQAPLDTSARNIDHPAFAIRRPAEIQNLRELGVDPKNRFVRQHPAVYPITKSRVQRVDYRSAAVFDPIDGGP